MIANIKWLHRSVKFYRYAVITQNRETVTSHERAKWTEQGIRRDLGNFACSGNFSDLRNITGLYFIPNNYLLFDFYASIWAVFFLISKNHHVTSAFATEITFNSFLLFLRYGI